MTNRWFLRTRSRFARVLPARYDLATLLFELTESITAVLGLCCSWVTLAVHSQLRFMAAVSQALAELERDHGQPYPPVPVLEAPIDTPRLWASRSSTGPCATRAGKDHRDLQRASRYRHQARGDAVFGTGTSYPRAHHILRPGIQPGLQRPGSEATPVTVACGRPGHGRPTVWPWIADPPTRPRHRPHQYPRRRGPGHQHQVEPAVCGRRADRVQSGAARVTSDEQGTEPTRDDDRE